ncbi:hypothetical protein [Streptomyces sp. NPDC003688]
MAVSIHALRTDHGQRWTGMPVLGFGTTIIRRECLHSEGVTRRTGAQTENVLAQILAVELFLLVRVWFVVL